MVSGVPKEKHVRVVLMRIFEYFCLVLLLSGNYMLWY